MKEEHRSSGVQEFRRILNLGLAWRAACPISICANQFISNPVD
jgi:hypothetical protein